MENRARDWKKRHQDLVARLARGLDLRIETGAAAGQAEIAEALDGLADLTQAFQPYLAYALDPQTMRASARAHYCLLLSQFTPAALRRLIAANVPIWRFGPESPLSIDLRLEHWIAREGELTLEFFTERRMLYLMSFSFVPAPPLGLPGETVVLLSRVQGRPDAVEDIRGATKNMSEVSPRAALFAALTGIAAAAGVRHIVGIAAESHVGYLPAKRDIMVRQYDDFFLTLDAVPHRDGLYLIDTGAEPKPVTAQKTGHRVRTRRKRELKAGIAQAVAEVWRGFRPPA